MVFKLGLERKNFKEILKQIYHFPDESGFGLAINNNIAHTTIINAANLYITLRFMSESRITPPAYNAIPPIIVLKKFRMP